MKAAVVLMLWLLIANVAAATEKADAVVVKKSDHQLFLVKNGKIIKQFHIALGGNPKGHKQQEGDQRTPEGKYKLDYKTTQSGYYKAFHISYPNQADINNARKRGVQPGGQILIHGQPNGRESYQAITQKFDWTLGCIALTNADMDEVWAAVDAGTPIDIKP